MNEATEAIWAAERIAEGIADHAAAMINTAEAIKEHAAAIGDLAEAIRSAKNETK